MSDADLDREVCLIQQGYWFYTLSGLPQPGCVARKAFRVPNGKQKKRATTWFFGLMFAIETENRIRPIVLQQDLNAALARILDDRYDWAPAQALEARYRAAWLIACRPVERMPTAMERARLDPARNGALRLQQELAAKQLPAGRAANMALIRSIVHGRQVAQ